MTVKLSICIPTYNREKYLRQLLDSIARQPLDDVEVVVSDNASPDDTEQVLREFSRKINRLVVHRWDKNVGADRNYLKVVELASGEYCWFMGSDDIIPDGSIAKIILLLTISPDIAIIGRNICSIDLVPMGTETFLEERISAREFDFLRHQEFLEYLNACRSLGGVFSYLSAIIVRRRAWQSVRFDESFIGTAYSHVYVLMKISLNGAKLCYTPEPLVTFRGGNDSFKTNLLVRGLLDLRGYTKLADALIEDQEIKKGFLHTMQRQHDFISIIKMFGSCLDKELATEYKQLAIRFEIPSWKLRLAQALQPFSNIAYRIKYRG